jgi:hypothetical protein
MKESQITIKNILDLDKKLIVIIGKDEKLKKAIRDRALKPPHIRRVITNLENNLHPYEQCRMIEQLAIQAQTADTLLFTNSTYFVDHLVNLMKAAKSKKKEYVKDKFMLKDKKAFIKVKDVAVFDCEDGKIKNILKRGGFIDWDSFSKVSEWASDLFFKMED